MKKLLVLFSMLAASLCLGAVPFLSHQGPGPFDSYLAMNVEFREAHQYLPAIEKDFGVTLKHRGEAHITVITPPEYWEGLRKHLTMGEIEAIAQKLNIQTSDYVPRCVGVGAISEKGKTLKTFYVVVESKSLLEIREAVRKAYEIKAQKAGDLAPSKFMPKAFYPHLTIGFTERDLHESDGIIKDEKSCTEQVAIKKSKR